MLLKCTRCGQIAKFTCTVTQTHRQIVDGHAEVLEDDGDIQDSNQDNYRCFLCGHCAMWEIEEAES
jgi:uncharacterized cupin superfamily protein